MPRKSKKLGRKFVYQGKTILPDVSAIVTATETKQGGIRLRGQLRDAATGTTLEKGSGTAGSAEEANIRAQALVVRLVQQQMEKQAKHNQSAETGEAIYTQLFRNLSDREKLELCPVTWRETTCRQGLKYFELTMLPILDGYGGSLTQADADDILEDIRKKAFANTRRAENDSVTDAKVRQHAFDFNRLYSAFRMATGEELLPELKLPVPNRQKTVRSEHTKALPLAVQVKQVALYFRLISNGLTLGAALMKLGGLRTAEACGLRFCDIEAFEDYAVVWVLKQLKNDGLSNELKRDDSYRPVIVPRLAVDLLRARIEHLMSLGYTREQINVMPVVSRWDDPTLWAQRGDLSVFVREILGLLGMTAADWEDVERIMSLEKDRDENGKPITDACAYLERRNHNTMLVNVCGIDSDMTDALSGRKLYCDARRAEQIDNDLHNRDKWPEIAARLERLVLDPSHSAHPLFRPIVVAGSCEQTYDIAQTGYTFTAEEDCELEITLWTVVAGDCVVVESDARLRNKNVLSDPFQAENMVIGKVHEREWYEGLIAEANKLDVSKILPPAAEHRKLGGGDEDEPYQ